MAVKKNKNTTKNKIVAAAWKLFYDQGYEDTTIDEIVEESGTSKGSFYHYFESKDALLGSLSIIFDTKYEELSEKLDPESDALSKLRFLNRELFSMIDSGVPLDLLTRLLSSQLVTKGEKHLMDRDRTYFRLIHSIIRSGQEKGEIRKDFAVSEIVKAYALFERGLMYDWCLSGGDYALAGLSDKLLPLFLEGFRAEDTK